MSPHSSVGWPMHTSTPRLTPHPDRFLTDQFFANDFEAVEIAQHRQSNMLLIEEGAGDALYIFRCYFLDAFGKLVEREETSEVHLLPGEVRHPARSRLQAEHERALEVILGAAELFGGNEFLLEIGEFPQNRLDHQLC